MSLKSHGFYLRGRLVLFIQYNNYLTARKNSFIYLDWINFSKISNSSSNKPINTRFISILRETLHARYFNVILSRSWIYGLFLLYEFFFFFLLKYPYETHCSTLTHNRRVANKRVTLHPRSCCYRVPPPASKRGKTYTHCTRPGGPGHFTKNTCISCDLETNRSRLFRNYGILYVLSSAVVPCAT